MPTFEIPDGPTTVELKRSGDPQGPATGSVAFSVTNKSADSCAGRLTVVVSGNSKQDWFTIDGDRERTFAPGETQTATIEVSAPAGAAPGDYPFRLRALVVNDPDNDHAEGPAATAKVPPPPIVNGGHGVPWWVWLILGLVLLIGLGIGGYFLFSGGNEPEPQPVHQNTVTPPTPVPTPSSRINLEPGYDRPGLDVRVGETVADVRACAKLCVATEDCVALTYVYQGPGKTLNGVCWIKNGIPKQVPNAYMVSGVKVPE